MHRRRYSGRQIAMVLACAAGLLAFRGDGAEAADRNAQLALQVQPDGGPFFRLKVKLWYNGEPQDFDIVVGCSVPYHIGEATWYGMVPEVFGRKMSDGKALLVRPPRACDGETTANGRVQPDLLPLVAVYDDAETLAFGTAYLSEDAYQNPLSVLKFGGATIEIATPAEFDEFRRTQKNVVTRAIFWSHSAGDDVLKKTGLPILAMPFGRKCEFYVRFRLPSELRAVLGLHWPSEKPDYWFAKTLDEENYLGRLINDSMHLQSDGPDDRADRPQHIGWGDVDRGFPTRAGGGLVSATRGKTFAGAYYPATHDDRANKWPIDPEGKERYFTAHDTFDYVDIDFRGGGTKGFAYCATIVNFNRASLESKLTAARVDGEPIWRSPSRPLYSTNLAKYVFERNGFVLLHFNVSLGPSRGDVW